MKPKNNLFFFSAFIVFIGAIVALFVRIKDENAAIKSKVHVEA